MAAHPEIARSALVFAHGPSCRFTAHAPLDIHNPYWHSVRMIKLGISGGQSAQDQAGWRAAQACDIPTGGWMPFGFLTEEGPQRWFSNVYGDREMPTKSYPARTVKNVQESDGALWFGTTDTPGAKTTLEARERLRRPDAGHTERSCASIGRSRAGRRNPQIERLKIAGNRESKNPGIGERIERFLTVFFNRMQPIC